MYIAGLNLGLTHNQGVEGLVAFTTTAQLLTTARLFSRGFKVSETEAGSIKPIPPTFLAKAISPVHITSTLAAPILYLLGVGLNRLEQPQWLLRLSFPASLDDMLGERGKAVVRVAACIGSICCFTLLRSSVAHLGPQLHFLGVRIFSSFKEPFPIANSPCRSARRPGSCRKAPTHTFATPSIATFSFSPCYSPPCSGHMFLLSCFLFQLVLLP